MLERLHRVAHQSGQVIGPVRQRRVIQRPGLRWHAHRLSPHLQHQRLPDAPAGLVGHRDADTGRCQPRDVLRAPGEGHRGMQRERQHADSGRRSQHVHPPRATGVHHDLTGAERSSGSEPGHQSRQHVVRDCEQHQVRPPHDIVGRQHRHIREQVRRASQ
jgi:hypothetical protein